MKIHGIQLNSQAIHSFCRKWRINELSVFGSILRDDFRPDSDIDFLVTYDENAEWDLSNHVQMQEKLGELVGRPVDLLTRYAVETDPNCIFRSAVLSSLKQIYTVQCLDARPVPPLRSPARYSLPPTLPYTNQS